MSADTPQPNAGEPAPEAEPVSRRGFIYAMIGVLGSLITALLAVPILGYVLSPLLKKHVNRTDLAEIGPLDKFPVNEPTVASFTFAGPGESPFTQGIYVLNKGNDEFVVYKINCTHLGCPYEWNSTARSFFCPCHGGSFDLDGKVLGGPPPRPLDQYQAVVQDGKLYAGALIQHAEG